MTTARLFMHNNNRLMMLREQRRVILNRVMLGVGGTCFFASIAFLAGLFFGGGA